MHRAAVIYSFRPIVLRRAANGRYVALQAGNGATPIRFNEDAAQLLAGYLMVNRAFFSGHGNGLHHARQFHATVLAYLKQFSHGATLEKKAVSHIIAHHGCITDWLTVYQ